MTRALMWFRTDLRTTDNLALAAACNSARDDVIGAFVLCPDQWREHNWGGNKVAFILRTLRDLSASLAKLRIPLLILTEDQFETVPRAIISLATKHHCSALFFNREYEVNEALRDAQAAALASKSNIEVHEHDDQVILAPGTVRTQEGRPFTVFTPFKNAWFKLHKDRAGVPCAPKPSRQTDTGIAPSRIPDSLPGFESEIDASLWPAGESHAIERLRSFIHGRIRNYKTSRDIPSLDGTSTLSPYLTIGAISPRQCLNAALEANKGKLEGGLAGADQWVTELVWREFYKHIIHAFPRISMGRAFKPTTDRLTWRYDEKDFKAWCKGRTGVPIVDAAIRQLNTTGWMHNRLRMVTAMYLTKDLFIDWRWGERYFMQKLIDGDLASNNGGWQWSASTGTDAAPYFRIFNPISQSRTHDPSGDFIRKWIPELRGLSNDEIHDPSDLPDLARARLDYPAPIVDHAKARDRVLKAFSALKP